MSKSRPSPRSSRGGALVPGIARGRGGKAGWAVIALLLVCVVAFLPLYNNGFVEYDDHIYITRNPEVLRGLSWQGVQWAFGTNHAGNWHPLTWISHMADVTLFGLDPRGHHLVNLLLHLGSTVLLFLALRRMTGEILPSFLAAAFFAVHPLRVESVAWASERKDVLSVFFWMLTMTAYNAYVRGKSWRTYSATVAAFALGLLSKPMVITLPFAMLLLDYWPLGRLKLNALSSTGPLARVTPPQYRLLYEKTPLFALAALSGIVTYLVQSAEGATRTWELYPVAARLTNAIVSYLRYIQKAFWPAGLAVFYPHPRETLPPWAGIVGAVFLAAVALLLVRASRRKPYLGVGWLWYLGTLVPVIGLVQVGGQAMADRYTYLPHVGLFIMVCWYAADHARRHARAAGIFGILGLIIILAFTGLTWVQAGTWRNTIELFSHAAKVTRDNGQAHLKLWTALSKAGRKAEAQYHLAEVRRISPGFNAIHAAQGLEIPEVRNSTAGRDHAQIPVEATAESWDLFRRGQTLIEEGRLEEATARFAGSLERSPNFIEARFALADALSRQGATAAAAAQYRDLLRRRPDHVGTHVNLAFELYKQGNLVDTEIHLKEALRLDGSAIEAHYNLGYLFLMTSRKAEAAMEYRAVLRLAPGHVAAMVGLADALADTGQTGEAGSWYRKALEIDPGQEKARRRLQALAPVPR